MHSQGKRVRPRPGDVILIPLRGSLYGFGRVLERAIIAFYDLRLGEVPEIDVILAAPVVFKIRVMKTAIALGAWAVLDNRALEPCLLAPPRFFMQDILTGECRVYHCGVERSASLSEIQGLECVAMWEPHHVVERLRDHFAGIPNATCEALKPTAVAAASCGRQT
jgi:hypothetical protein